MDKSPELTREQSERLFSLDKDAIEALRALLNDDRHVLRWDAERHEWAVGLRQ